MTSHYLRCTVQNSFEAVFDAVSKAFGNIYAKKLNKDGESSKGIILGERYFLRVNSDVAVSILLEERSSDETVLEIISCAGGTGIVEISYNAHAAYVHDVKNFLSNSGFRIEVEEEISYFSRGSARS